MYNKVTSENKSNLSINHSKSMQMKIKIVENFTLWQSVKDDEEIHIVIEGHPIIDMSDKILELHEGDILQFHKDEYYRYFSSGNSIIYCFNSNNS
ncbi:MAG: hypothetical protein JEZ08_01040 [Clostridiales bacterium]|nr:hypothetical protein [Clostridiales bacterium]